MSYKKERKKGQSKWVNQCMGITGISSIPALHNSTHNAVIDIAKERQLWNFMIKVALLKIINEFLFSYIILPISLS